MQKIHPPKGYVYDVRDIDNFKQLIISSAELFPDKCAFLLRDKDSSEESVSSEIKAVSAESGAGSGKDRPRGSGIFRKITYTELLSQTAALTAALRQSVPEGARIGVMGGNCYEWAISYLAVTCGVGIVVPLDKELKSDELQSVAGMAKLDMIICSDKLVPICTLSGAKVLSFSSIKDMLEKGQVLRAQGDRSFETHKIDSRGLGVLLFTSGTVGVSKGVMLSQSNICCDIVRVLRKVKVTPDDRVMSMLPLHHTYECTAGFLGMLYSGASITYCESIRTIARDFTDYAPTIFVAVPLVLENFRKNIIRNYKKIPGGKTVLKAQRRFVKMGRPPRTVFHQIHEFFGGRLRLFLCGAAPLAPEVFEDFETFGIKVYCGYGLTETSPIAIMHSDFYSSSENTGYPISGLSVKLDKADKDETGELLLKGDTVMLGYLDDPEATAAAFTEDGWFRTGDIARCDEHGRYTIVGREKTMIVTKNGKKIFPEELEYYLLESPYISECVVYGDEREHDTVVTAVVRPSYDAVNEQLKKDGIMPDSVEYEEALKSLIALEAKEASSHLPAFKAIRAVKIRRGEFSKTSTQKIRRGDSENYSE